MKASVSQSMKKQGTVCDDRMASPYPGSRTSRASHASIEITDPDEPELRAQRMLLNNTKTAIDHLKSVTGKRNCQLNLETKSRRILPFT